MNKDWKELIETAVNRRNSEVDFFGEVRSATRQLTAELRNYDRTITERYSTLARGGNRDEGIIEIKHGDQVEASFEIMIDGNGVLLRVWNSGPTDVRAGYPNDYTAASIRNLLAYLYHRLMNGMRIRQNLNPEEFQ